MWAAVHRVTPAALVPKISGIYTERLLRTRNIKSRSEILELPTHKQHFRKHRLSLVSTVCSIRTNWNFKGSTSKGFEYNKNKLLKWYTLIGFGATRMRGSSIILQLVVFRMLRFGYCSLFPTRLSANSSELSWAHLVLFSTRRTSEMLTKSSRSNISVSLDCISAYGAIGSSKHANASEIIYM